MSRRSVASVGCVWSVALSVIFERSSTEEVSTINWAVLDSNKRPTESASQDYCFMSNDSIFSWRQLISLCWYCVKTSPNRNRLKQLECCFGGSIKKMVQLVISFFCWQCGMGLHGIFERPDCVGTFTIVLRKQLWNCMCYDYGCDAFICHENEMIKDKVHKQLNSPFQNLSLRLTSILDLLIIHNGIHLVPSLVRWNTRRHSWEDWFCDM